MDQTQDSLEVSGNRDFGMVNITAGLYYMEEQYDFEYDFFGLSMDTVLLSIVKLSKLQHLLMPNGHCLINSC